MDHAAPRNARCDNDRGAAGISFVPLVRMDCSPAAFTQDVQLLEHYLMSSLDGAITTQTRPCICQTSQRLHCSFEKICGCEGFENLPTSTQALRAFFPGTRDRHDCLKTVRG